ncbi:MAG TPA: PilZ domain-containing protein [Candidatus Acidoferrales bacterium]|nr:PilZ domain-containing protein [Candidatus Acidoferrales bacterium]
MQRLKKSAYAAEHPPVMVQDDERRTGNRHLFTASADVLDIASGARFSARTTDLGPGGCFVDTLVPFPVGSRVRVSVRKSKREFQTEGVVVYSQQGLGMGIAFSDLSAKQREALHTWIVELAGVRFSAAEPAPQKPERRESETPGTAMMRLVQLLVSKGIMSEAEAASVFFDPVM